MIAFDPLSTDDRVRIIDLHPDLGDLRQEAIDGLRRKDKALPCKYFYDERGSQLFEEITRLPEYYPTETELGIMRDSIDEIAELDTSLQAKLLRVLQTHRFERLGGQQTIEVDLRVISATNKNLMDEIKTGHFREDLFYRLNVIPITVPPLSEREACKIALIKNHINYFSSKLKGRKPPRLSRRALDALLTYHYPGNIRELMNICERLVVMAESPRIALSDLPSTLTAALPAHITCGIDLMENTAEVQPPGLPVVDGFAGGEAVSLQLASHPSPFSRFPSSQSSRYSTVPFPQIPAHSRSA